MGVCLDIAVCIACVGQCALVVVDGCGDCVGCFRISAWGAQGFDALEFKEHLDYELVRSTNPAFGKAIIRINVFKTHRQVGLFVLPFLATSLSPRCFMHPSLSCRAVKVLKNAYSLTRAPDVRRYAPCPVNIVH